MCSLLGSIWRFPKNRAYILEGPKRKEYEILQAKLGSPYFGKLSHLLVHQSGEPFVRVRGGSAAVGRTKTKKLCSP